VIPWRPSWHIDVDRERPPALPLQVAIAVLAAILAGAAFAIAVTSGFLRYPAWLGLHHANLILGPVIVGLYWWRRRPASRLGPLLVIFGFITAPGMLQGATSSYLYSVGVFTDAPVFSMTLYLLLAFPTGRLRGRTDRAIVAATALLLLCSYAAYLLLSPQVAGGGPIAACRDTCPDNSWFITTLPGLTDPLATIREYGGSALALATAAVLVSRFVRGNPPQRRALAWVGSIGVVFCLTFAAYHLQRRIWPSDTDLRPWLQWTLAVARASVAWGMLVALAAAELYGGRLLARLVDSVLQRTEPAELERTVAAALDDPTLRLGFWSPDHEMYVDASGAQLAAPDPRSGRTLTEVSREGQKAVAVLHDEQLREGPELVQAAGAAALLARENARLEGDLREVIADLRGSRARLVAASDAERRRLERDLHDGAQQQFIAFRMKLGMIRDDAVESLFRLRLGELDSDLERALDALRALALGIYPAVLADEGLGAALGEIGDRADIPVTVAATVGRFPLEVESAMYYCALEALQNAGKHAGPGAATVILVDVVDGALQLTVRDRGWGFDTAMTPPGEGLRNMRDRIGAIGGELVVHSVPGRGTVVRARVPADRSSDTLRRVTSQLGRSARLAATDARPRVRPRRAR
jgi:signal transduction histidine kinase